MPGVVKKYADERNELRRVFRRMLDKGATAVEIGQWATDALLVALVDEARCGYVIVDLEHGIYRCARNPGHDGEHGRRR